MKISFIDIQNFRKLQSTRIEFSPDRTLFVGANNSGKTSAIAALRVFLVDPKELSIQDISIGRWKDIDEVGKLWEKEIEEKASEYPGVEASLPSLDIWLDASIEELHHVAHILPHLDWKGGKIGVRLQFALIDEGKCRAAYKAARKKVEMDSSQVKQGARVPRLKPECLMDFFKSNLSRHLEVRAYRLDPKKATGGESARPQELSEFAHAFDKNPLAGLIKVDEIPANRDLSDGDSSLSSDDGEVKRGAGNTRKLSGHVRRHYDQYRRSNLPMSPSDLAALSAFAARLSGPVPHGTRGFGW